MRTPNILPPTELSNKVLAERFIRHPGPYMIGDCWQEDLDKIFPEIMKIPYDVSKVGQPTYGEMNESETELLFRIVFWLKPSNLVEYGTLYGRGTKIMSENSPQDARILTVDLKDEERLAGETPYSTDMVFAKLNEMPVGAKYQNSPSTPKIKQERMNATSPEFARTLDDFLKGETIDFALIDAAHDYDTTKALFELSLPRMSHGGVIMTDDYAKLPTHVGVTRYFAEAADTQGLLLYHFNPLPIPQGVKETRQSGLFFINSPEAKNRNWKT